MADSPGMVVTSSVRLELVEHAEHAGLDLGDLGAARGQVGQGVAGAFQGAGPLPGHPGPGLGGVGGGVEHQLYGDDISGSLWLLVCMVESLAKLFLNVTSLGNGAAR